MNERVLAALQPGEKILRTLVDQVQEGLVAVDLDGNFLVWNPAATEILGYGASLSDPADWGTLYGLHDPETMRLLTLEEMPLHRALHSQEQAQVEMLVINSTCPEGKWVLVRAQPIYDDGVLSGALAQLFDYTATRKTDLASRMMMGLFQSCQDGIVNVDPDGIVESWNPGAESIFGYTSEEILGQSCLQLVPDELLEDLSALLVRLKQGHPCTRIYTYGKHKDGRSVEVARSVTPVRDSRERLLGFCTIVTDMTRTRETERELLASREQLRQLSARLQAAQEQELNRISRELHDELGQLLTGLKMDLAWLDARLGDREPDLSFRVTEMHQLLEQTMQSVRRLATQMRPQLLETMGLRAALGRLLDQTSSRAGFKFKLSVQAQVERRLTQCSPDALTCLYRICQEGLTNVSKHARAALVLMEITDVGPQLRLHIEDDGRGLPAAEVASTRGLGLVGMRERAHLWGGTLEIEAGQPGGTRLRVLFPWNRMLLAVDQPEEQLTASSLAVRQP